MGNTIIIEGRYDFITGKVVKDIMNVMKKSIGYPEDDLLSLTLPHTLDGTEDYVIASNGVTFSVDLNIIRQEGKYKVESSKVDDEDIIEINIALDPEYEQQYYEKIYYKLQEDVRHEMEHVLQDYAVGDRPAPIPETGDETTYEHHSKLDEVPAMVGGFYRRAKLERRALDEVMIEDLDSEIEKENITKEEAKELFRIWSLYARRRYPKAIYSED